MLLEQLKWRNEIKLDNLRLINRIHQSYLNSDPNNKKLRETVEPMIASHRAEIEKIEFYLETLDNL